MNKHNKYIELLSTNLEERQKYYKKILFIVSLSQVFGGAGLAAGLTVGALIAKDILGTDTQGYPLLYSHLVQLVQHI